MAGTLHVFDFLAAPDKAPRASVVVLFGPERFLKKLAIAELTRQLFGKDAEDASIRTFDGESTDWRDVVDELSTRSLFGSTLRVAVVQDADDFVSQYRDKLEEYVAHPKSTGVLILLPQTWSSNTRLYKQVDASGLQIVCRPPEVARQKSKSLDEGRVCRWLTHRAKTAHGVVLGEPAARELFDLVGPEFGLLDQELAKCALFVAPGESVPPEIVRDAVGGWRTKTTWELIDAALDGNTAEAFKQLDQLLHAGQEPVMLFGALAWSLRRFAAAVRIFQSAERSGTPVRLAAALEKAGFRKWPPKAMETAERQMIQLGRQRVSRFYRWLLDTDLALKGSHSSPDRARLALEKLFLKMARV